MPLFKDLSNNLNKILMQSNKSSLQLENTIVSTKTSIKSIKYLKKNVKESKIINDESNKAFEEFNLSSNEFFIEIEKYLRNPTPEKLLKAKNQINESYNNLKIATTAFSKSKTFTRKLVDSFNEYKKNVLINNAKIEKLIEWYQRLILSFKKNIRIITPVSKLKTQTRKIYYSETPTPSPECPKLKKDLIAKEKERDDAKKELDVFIDQAILRDSYRNAYENKNKANLEYIESEKKRLDNLKNEFFAYFTEIDELAKINSDITRNEKAIINNINRNYFKKVNDLKENAKFLLALQGQSILKITASIKIIGNYSEDLITKQQEENNKFREYISDASDDYKEWQKIQNEIDDNNGMPNAEKKYLGLLADIKNLKNYMGNLNCP
jgi:hypothetical protein